MTTLDDDDEVPAALAGGPAVADGQGWRKNAVRARLFEDPQTPARIGRFIVLGVLGRGGMGSVLRAYDETLDRQIAVKLMHPDVHAQRDRMLREAQALARLSHPNVVQVYEVGEVDDQLFIAMELIGGQTLEQWQREPRAWRQCLEAYVQAGRGLAAAHAAGMIHRDFKPSNCIMDEAGRVRVLDFGLARNTQPGAEEEPLDRPDSSEAAGSMSASPSSSQASSPSGSSSAVQMLRQRLTVTGSVLGTVAYMAPEQMRGKEIDARADQYSFCVSLHEALFGDRLMPHLSGTRLRRTTGAQRTVSNPARVPRWLLRVIERGLAKDPAERWPSMDALLEALERHQRRRSAGWLGAAALTVGLAIAGASLGGDPAAAEPVDPCHDADAPVAGTWDDAQHERVRRAIFATGVPFAAQTWTSVSTQLDGYADALRTGHGDACEATMVRHEQTLEDRERRTQCLGERVGALAQTIAVLEGADARVVENAVTMVTALPDLDACADVEALRRVAERSPDASAREELREPLLQARALATAGKLTEGLEVIEPLLRRAQDSQDASFLAEARLVEGILQAELRQAGPASTTLRTALEGALAHGDEAIAIEALSELVYLVGVEQAKVDAGTWLGTIAVALVEREGTSPRAEARVLTAVGELATNRGEYDLAQQQLEHALELLRRSVGDDHIALADPLNALGVALHHQGKRVLVEQQAALARAHSDPDAPPPEPTPEQRARAEQARETMRRALALSSQALQIRTHWQGPQHPETADQHVNVGVVLDDLDERDQAQQHYRTALEILAPVAERHPYHLALARTSRGVSLAQQGEFPAATIELTAAVQSWETEHGPQHPRVAQARLSLAGVMEADGHFEDAVAQYERAREILEGSDPTPANEATLSSVLMGLVRSQRALGHETAAAAIEADLRQRDAPAD